MRYRIKFKTLGMSMYAGEAEASTVDGCKAAATDLLSRRRLRSLDAASIEDQSGTEVAVLNMSAYRRSGAIEWLTIRS